MQSPKSRSAANPSSRCAARDALLDARMSPVPLGHGEREARIGPHLSRCTCGLRSIRSLGAALISAGNMILQSAMVHTAQSRIDRFEPFWPWLVRWGTDCQVPASLSCLLSMTVEPHALKSRVLQDTACSHRIYASELDGKPFVLGEPECP